VVFQCGFFGVEKGAPGDGVDELISVVVGGGEVGRMEGLLEEGIAFNPEGAFDGQVEFTKNVASQAFGADAAPGSLGDIFCQHHVAFEGHHGRGIRGQVDDTKVTRDEPGGASGITPRTLFAPSFRAFPSIDVIVDDQNRLSFAVMGKGLGKR